MSRSFLRHLNCADQHSYCALTSSRTNAYASGLLSPSPMPPICIGMAVLDTTSSSKNPARTFTEIYINRCSKRRWSGYRHRRSKMHNFFQLVIRSFRPQHEAPYRSYPGYFKSSMEHRETVYVVGRSAAAVRKV